MNISSIVIRISWRNKEIAIKTVIFSLSVLISVQRLNSSRDNCENAHILYEKLYFSLTEVLSGSMTTRHWYKRAIVQHQYWLKGSAIYLWIHHWPKVTTLGIDGAEIQIQSSLRWPEHTQLFHPISIPSWLKCWACTFPPLYNHCISITNLFWSNTSICILVKTSNNLQPKLLNKEIFQRSNKVCKKKIALLKHTLNLHCQIAHLSI